jgi:DNA-binding NtrC family response regulator
VITDLRMPGIDGTRVIETALERYPGIVGIVITGYGTMKDAVDAIKRGASDFIAKPFQFDELMHVLQKAIEQRRLKSENAYLRSQLEERYQFAGILGHSRAMRELFQLLETVSRSSSTILITGETGTGKEVVARAIHHSSPRRAPPIRGAQLQCDSRDAPRGGTIRACARCIYLVPSAPGRDASSRRTRERCFWTRSGR